MSLFEGFTHGFEAVAEIVDQRVGVISASLFDIDRIPVIEPEVPPTTRRSPELEPAPAPRLFDFVPTPETPETPATHVDLANAPEFVVSTPLQTAPIMDSPAQNDLDLAQIRSIVDSVHAVPQDRELEGSNS